MAWLVFGLMILLVVVVFLLLGKPRRRHRDNRSGDQVSEAEDRARSQIDSWWFPG